jgi:hypothetical protein
MKNNIKFILYFLLIIICSYSFAETSLKQKYSEIMLTDDYGIVKEVDIIHDIKKYGRKLVRWQCFPIKNAKLSSTKWKENDPQGSSDEIVDLYDYSITINGGALTHFYYDRRARNKFFFSLFQKDWKRLTKNQQYFCINGEPWELDGKIQGWVWNKIQTKKGCFSIFTGDCGHRFPDK